MGRGGLVGAWVWWGWGGVGKWDGAGMAWWGGVGCDWMGRRGKVDGLGWGGKNEVRKLDGMVRVEPNHAAYSEGLCRMPGSASVGHVFRAYACVRVGGRCAGGCMHVALTGLGLVDKDGLSGTMVVPAPQHDILPFLRWWWRLTT